MSPSLGNLLNQRQFKVAEFSPLREGEVVVAVVVKNNDWLFTGPNEDPSWQQTSGQWSLTTMGRIKLSTKFRFFTIFGVVKAAFCTQSSLLIDSLKDLQLIHNRCQSLKRQKP